MLPNVILVVWPIPTKNINPIANGQAIDGIHDAEKNKPTNAKPKTRLPTISIKPRFLLRKDASTIEPSLAPTPDILMRRPKPLSSTLRTSSVSTGKSIIYGIESNTTTKVITNMTNIVKRNPGVTGLHQLKVLATTYQKNF